jgi:glucosamine kinase
MPETGTSSILIADSGSTKTEWRLIRPGSGPVTVFTAGLNPYYHTSESLTGEITRNVAPEISEAGRIFFYGAGCTGREAVERVAGALKTVYGDIPVEVASDLLGAARAVCGRREGIACILGTGSNSCYYDGTMIVDRIPTLGFVLGDEGSAGYFGRKILQAYFYREMPDELREWLDKHHNMSRQMILESVYKEEHPNTYVASFARIFSEFDAHPWVTSLLFNGISEFLQRHVLKYRTASGVRVGFVGSVAAFNRPVVEAALDAHGLKSGRFLPSPMDGLAAYHENTK